MVLSFCDASGDQAVGFRVLHGGETQFVNKRAVLVGNCNAFYPHNGKIFVDHKGKDTTAIDVRILLCQAMKALIENPLRLLS